MRNKTILLALLSVLLTTLLAGCSGSVSLSPEDAVVNAFDKNTLPADITVDKNSLQVLQSQQVGDNYLVLLTFQGTHAKAGTQTCLYTYLATRSMGGWANSGNGGGGCANPPANPSAQPITVFTGVGKSAQGGKDDPGYSSVSGQIWLQFVKIVRVTWSDGKVEQLGITNNSFFSSRTGQFSCTKVEAINEVNQILYTYLPAPAQVK